ncbi:MAG TPA: metalloregulator ArsR/SmtB family transcription factor [Candidatus Limnocylindrales bacterium]|nr:metalloregulator ArsR/SmtB family transcription factor [Candidatus Limnocylindrales bacterium]
MRDFTAASASFSIEWDVRPAFDFILSLSEDSGTTDDLPEADRTWLADALAALPEASRQFLAHGTPGRMVTIHLAGFLVDHPELRTAAYVVAAIRATSPEDLFPHLVGEMHDVDHAELKRALAGDRSATDAILARVDGHKSEALAGILADPNAAYDGLVALLEAWAPAFATVEPRVAGIIQRDYDLRAADRERLGGVELVEQTTGGIRIMPEPAIRRVILAPSYFSRPFNYLFGGTDWRFAGYPVADAALDVDPLSPPPSVLRLHRALGDATRLRILKALAEKDLYGTELAALLDISKPTVTHHMVQLRAAGLVTAVQAGSAVYYSLRRERLQDALGDLTRFLVG